MVVKENYHNKNNGRKRPTNRIEKMKMKIKPMTLQKKQ